MRKFAGIVESTIAPSTNCLGFIISTVDTTLKGSFSASNKITLLKIKF